MSIMGVGREDAAELLSAADGDVELATEMFLADRSVDEQKQLVDGTSTKPASVCTNTIVD
eukprot:gene8059-63584_t